MLNRFLKILDTIRTTIGMIFFVPVILLIACIVCIYEKIHDLIKWPNNKMEELKTADENNEDESDDDFEDEDFESDELE